MAGISHVLNIAKEALLTHQYSVQVAAHNIANVDTPGYTRQNLGLTTNTPTSSVVGNLGGGVKGQTVVRQYDQFMTQRIIKQESTMGNLQAQQEAMRVVETIFNEAPGLMLNDLMSQFWASWQDLSDNPELLAARQSVVQMGHLLHEQLLSMTSEIARTRYDIGMSLESGVSDVNSLTSQIARLNLEITSAEGLHKQANDLRDRRDLLVRELSELIDINYFEDKAGAYTVLLADGRSLVGGNENSRLQWSDNTLNWIGTNKDGKEIHSPLGSGAKLGGKIGGWLEVRGELRENDPDNFLGRLDALANALIREVNQQHSRGVGTLLFSGELIGSEIAADTAALTTVVDPLSARETIAAGTLQINGRPVGKIEGGSTADTAGLAMTKAANAVAAINEAITGVSARLTTLYAGDSVSGNTTETNISFELNGILITTDLIEDGSTANIVANAIAFAVNDEDLQKSTGVKAKVEGNEASGYYLIFQNINDGDESRIIIEEIEGGNLDLTGLTAGSHAAGPKNNTGEITLFSDQPFTVKAGTDDTFLAQLGMTLVHPEDRRNDGQFTFAYDDGGIKNSLMGFKYADELQTDGGSFDIWLYNADGSPKLPQPVNVKLDGARTLGDVAEAVNAAVAGAGVAGSLHASVIDNRLVLKPENGHQFAFANDNSNFLQVAGLNTFFTGHSAGTLKVNEAVAGNLEFLAAGRVGEHGQVFRGDNSNALLITNIPRDENVRFTGGSANTLDGFYNALVAGVGNKGRALNRSYEYNSLVTSQLQEMRDATSGVSLDEEMANLIKFQHAYSAAAKLITTSDEMLLTLLHSVGR